jgi:SAM-dependent methyltransferase
MKFSLRPQTLVEWVAKWFNLAPIPVVHTQLYALLARALYEAVGLGVFEAIGTERLTAAEIAQRSRLHERALTPLLRVLEAAGYLRTQGERFSLSSLSRKWLLSTGPDSVRDHLLFMRREWHWHDHLPRFLQTGEGLRIHEALQPGDWGLYRRGMASAARLSADEVGRKTPLPANPHRLLDVGGSHGLYADWFCRQHPTLHADVLDLPDAVADAPSRERVRYLAGDALAHPLPEREYDAVFLCQVSHHLTADQNRCLARRAATALRPGGYFVVVELLREEADAEPEISRSLVSLFFGLTSAGGLWSATEIQDWQHAAGLVPLTPRALLSLPGGAVLAARKP